MSESDLRYTTYMKGWQDGAAQKNNSAAYAESTYKRQYDQGLKDGHQAYLTAVHKASSIYEVKQC